MSEVVKLEGEAGNFKATVKTNPRSVDPDKVHRLRRLHRTVSGQKRCAFGDRPIQREDLGRGR